MKSHTSFYYFGVDKYQTDGGLCWLCLVSFFVVTKEGKINQLDIACVNYKNSS